MSEIPKKPETQDEVLVIHMDGVGLFAVYFRGPLEEYKRFKAEIEKLNPLKIHPVHPIEKTVRVGEAIRVANGRTESFKKFDEDYANRIIVAYKELDLSAINLNKYKDLSSYLVAVQESVLNTETLALDPNCFRTAIEVINPQNTKDSPKIEGVHYNFATSPEITVFTENSNILIQSFCIAVPFILFEISKKNAISMLDEIFVFNDDYEVLDVNKEVLKKLVKNKDKATNLLYQVLLALRKGPNGFVVNIFSSIQSVTDVILSDEKIGFHSIEKLKSEAINEQKERSANLQKIFEVLLKYSDYVSFVFEDNLPMLIGSSYGCPLKPDKEKEKDPFWHIAKTIMKAVEMWYYHTSSTHQEQ